MASLITRRFLHYPKIFTKHPRFSAPLTQNYSSQTDKNNADQPIFDMENPFTREKRQCILCKLNITPDYKNVKLLSQFQSSYTGRVYGRHITGLCEHKQKLVEREIVKAQCAGMMSGYLKEECYLADPKLFDPEKPLRPHRF